MEFLGIGLIWISTALHSSFSKYNEKGDRIYQIISLYLILAIIISLGE